MKQFFWNKILNRVGVIRLLLLFTLSQANGNDTLLSPPSSQGNIISVGIITPEMPIGNEVVIGKVNKSEKKMGDSHFKGMVGNAINLDHTIVQSFEDSYITPFYESHNYENYSGILKPKLFLKPVIKSLNLELQGGKLLKSLSGKCNISCTWNIYTANDKNKIISTININSMVERKEENYELILHTLIRQSAKDLLAIDTLHNYFEQLQLKYLAETVGAKLVVKGAKANDALTKKEAFKLAKDAAVTISTQNGFGSGVIITNDGYIITNHHVVADSGEIKVRFNNGTEFNAKLIKSNPDFDVALIKIESKTDKLMSFGKDDNISEGDQVYAIGTPLDKSLNQTVTGGIVSGKREINNISMIQTDVTLNEGNSGGPVINETGEILGIATMKLSGAGIEGIGFCIPSGVVIKALNLELLN